MTEQSAYTFSYFTDLTSAAMRTNNQQGELFRQLALAMPSGDQKCPHSRPSLRSGKTNRLKRSDLRCACVSKSQVFVCYSVPLGYPLISAHAIIIISTYAERKASVPVAIDLKYTILARKQRKHYIRLNFQPIFSRYVP